MINKNKSQKNGKKKVNEDSHELVTNCDHIENDEIIISQSDIEKMIVTIRGEQVLIDRDLAYSYHVEVKQMNRQVKRNIKRFPEDFMFQLTKEENNSLKCQNGTSNKRGGDRPEIVIERLAFFCA